MKQVDESSDGKQIDVASGDTLEVRLQENRTTGHKWILESEGGAVCSQVSDAFEPGDAVGQPGTHVWVFRAEKQGSADITLAYRRPWEEKQTPVRTFTLHVRVSA